MKYKNFVQLSNTDYAFMVDDYGYEGYVVHYVKDGQHHEFYVSAKRGFGEFKQGRKFATSQMFNGKMCDLPNLEQIKILLEHKDALGKFEKKHKIVHKKFIFKLLFMNQTGLMSNWGFKNKIVRRSNHLPYMVFLDSATDKHFIDKDGNFQDDIYNYDVTANYAGVVPVCTIF